MNVTKSIVLLVCAFIVGSACAGLGSTEAHSDLLGEIVGSVVKMPDGGQAALYRRCAEVMRPKAGVASRESAGEWRMGTYQLIITGADGKSTEVEWKADKPLSILNLCNPPFVTRILDARSEANAVTVLFLDAGLVRRYHFVCSPEGNWCRTESGVVPYRELPERNRIVVKGQLIGDYVAQLDYKNGDMEQWQFKPNEPNSVVMIDHNDLKVIFLELSDAAASGLFRVRQQ